MKIVSCWIEHPVYQLNKTFTYLCEDELETGTRVLVNFNNRKTIGFVESVEDTTLTNKELEEKYGYKLKFIDEVIDEHSLLTDELYDLAIWMADFTLSTTISCFQAILPPKLKPSKGEKNVVKEKWVKVSDEEVSLTLKELEAYHYVNDNQPLTYSQLRKQYPNQARNLINKGAIYIEEVDRQAKDTSSLATSKPLPLTPQQQKAFEEIKNSNDSVYLLNGVTGSGKTEIYLQLSQEQLEQGKQVLILVPEIGLTPQMIERVQSRFGMDLAIYHSRLSSQEKYEQYQKVKQGRARIVVGTRSSVFLPFEQLGLIVMDEEHDSSYKQDNQPTYHCRDVAIHRGTFHNCKVVLGSATPSLESYARALKNVYHLVNLDERINGNPPRISTVSVKKAIKDGESYILTNTLIEKIHDRLANKQQVILLLNRRGYSTQLRCRNCQSTILCPHCDLAMSYHRDDKVMKCHNCGTMIPVPRYCPSCNSTKGFTTYGYGTQKLESEVKTLFPNARILRMDADTTTKKNSHETILTAFGNGEADILLGTQMIAKGLDFPRVTLVGIINGDEGLNRTDFRSCEHTFDLLMQASGRSGRSDDIGEVVIQVFDEEHYVVQNTIRQDYVSFFNQEMQFRHAGQYPPYTYMISIVVSARNQSQADTLAQNIMHSFNGSYKVVGIISLVKLNDYYRNRIILKGKDLQEMHDDVKKMLEETKGNVKDIKIDVNPLRLD